MNKSQTSTSSASASKSSSKVIPKVPVSKTNLNRSAGSSNQSLNSTSGTSETASASTVRASSTIRRSPSSNEILTENIDDFAIGDRVYVNGTRPGIIRFLGETQFAPGLWSGIELEESDGKNDGSVANVRYFTCQPKYGVFVRPQRLTNKPIEHMNGSNGSSSPKKVSPSRDVSPPRSASVLKGKNNGQHSVMEYESKFQVGDRILVNATSGTKLGTLMFLGPTEFATGLWAGIELDEGVGKNDGSVAGKRYFTCEMRFGLFAPVHKISPAPLSALKVNKKTTKKQASGISRQRSDSRESLASVSSTASSTHRPNRVRLGVTSLSSSTQKVTAPGYGQSKSSSGSSSAANVSAAAAALHEALKEKEEHITQLLKERDLERGEVARAASQADDLEEKLTILQHEHNKVVAEADEEISELKRLNQEYEEEHLKLNTQLEDERKKIEDLQFRLEEETITKTDLESQMESLKQEIDAIKSGLKARDSPSPKVSSSNSETEALMEKLKTLEAQKDQELFMVQEDLVRKEEQCLQLEASLDQRKTEITNLLTRVSEFEHELDIAKKKSERQVEAIDEINYQLKKEESQRRALTEENTALKKSIDDNKNKMRAIEEKFNDLSVEKKSVAIVNDRIKELERQLLAKEEMEKTLEESLIETKARYESFETEVNQLAMELKKLRSQCDDELRQRKTAEERLQSSETSKKQLENQLQEMMRTSGSNSDLMVKLNSEFMDKQKEYDRKERILRDEIESVKRVSVAKDAELKDIKIEIENKKSLMTKLEEKYNKMDKQLRDNETKIKLVIEDNDEKQKIITELRDRIEEFKSQMSRVIQERDDTNGDLQYKMNHLETSYRRLEDERDTCLHDIRKLKDATFELEVERDRLKRDYDQVNNQLKDRQKIIDTMKDQVENMKTEFGSYQKNLQDQLNQSKLSSQALEEFKSEMDRQKQLCNEMEDENLGLRDDNRHLKEKVEELRDDVESIEKRHREVMAEFEYECERLQQKVTAAEQLADDRAHQLRELDSEQRTRFDNYRRDAEDQKRSLESKLNELEAKVRESIANANIVTRDRNHHKETNDDDHEQQIEFLNSVIVDMQKKNDDLKHRIQVLEEIGMTEFEISPSRGNSSRVTNGHIRPPRLFCDICDMFDIHDTEDCPQQAMNFEEVRTHSHYSSSRREERPFCDNCEVFGHWTVNCVETETF